MTFTPETDSSARLDGRGSPPSQPTEARTTAAGPRFLVLRARAKAYARRPRPRRAGDSTPTESGSWSLEHAADAGPGLLASVQDLARHRELLWSLTAREILVRYKQAALGVAWAILQPLALMVVFAVFFGFFVRVPSDGLPYSIFFFVALVPWTFFATALSFAVPSLSANAYLITKVRFPREVLPLAAVLSAAVDFAIGLALLFGMLPLYRIPLTWNALFVLPLFAIQLIFTVAIALALSALNVRYRDVRYVLPLLMQIWLYVSPVLYPVSVVPERLRSFYLLNPMAALIDGYRRCLAQGLMPRVDSLLIALAVSVLLLLLSYRAFKAAERAFADVI